MSFKREYQDQAPAIIYCEGNFGSIDGKTANGLVRNSETYKILAIIDSSKAGQDSGLVLDGVANSIPIYGDLEEALSKSETIASHLIFGMAPASGKLSAEDRKLILKAINLNMNIVNGLHEFFNDDQEFLELSQKMKVSLIDVRKPLPKDSLRQFTGRINKVTCPKIAILGTDCAIGKRTTATILGRTLKDHGLNAIMISTGQTGLIQGNRYGVALDAVPSQYCAGELESVIVEAFEKEDPDVIIIEGQGALSHPAYSTSSFILRGACPDAVILQHAPSRTHLCDFDFAPMPKPETEIHLIQTFAKTKVIGLTLNHEKMTSEEVSQSIEDYEKSLNIPVTDALGGSTEALLKMIIGAFPDLSDKIKGLN